MPLIGLGFSRWAPSLRNSMQAPPNQCSTALRNWIKTTIPLFDISLKQSNSVARLSPITTEADRRLANYEPESSLKRPFTLQSRYRQTRYRLAHEMQSLCYKQM